MYGFPQKVAFQLVGAWSLTMMREPGDLETHQYKDATIPESSPFFSAFFPWEGSIWGGPVRSPQLKHTLLGTNISPQNGILKMIFLFPRWDMLIPWRVFLFVSRFWHHARSGVIGDFESGLEADQSRIDSWWEGARSLPYDWEMIEAVTKSICACNMCIYINLFIYIYSWIYNYMEAIRGVIGSSCYMVV